MGAVNIWEGGFAVIYTPECPVPIQSMLLSLIKNCSVFTPTDWSKLAHCGRQRGRCLEQREEQIQRELRWGNRMVCQVFKSTDLAASRVGKDIL